MYGNRTEESPFKGWLLFFLIYHVIVALVMFSNGLTSIYSLMKQGGQLWFALLNSLFFFPLPVALVFFMRRNKKAFYILFIIYCACAAMMFIANAVDSASASGLSSVQGIMVGIVVTCILVLPWLIYVFASKRMKAFFESASLSPSAGQPPEKENGK